MHEADEILAFLRSCDETLIPTGEDVVQIVAELDEAVSEEGWLPCKGCETPIHPDRHARFGYCIPCNADRQWTTLVAVTTGFKNNGFSLATAEEHRQHMQTQHVRG